MGAVSALANAASIAGTLAGVPGLAAGAKIASAVAEDVTALKGIYDNTKTTIASDDQATVEAALADLDTQVETLKAKVDAELTNDAAE